LACAKLLEIGCDALGPDGGVRLGAIELNAKAIPARGKQWYRTTVARTLQAQGTG
jgi:hypothetical protein